nr:uncharacterized protein LOC129453057 [Misgurnus anguillicaudatus]
MNFRLSSLILLLHIQGSLTLDNFNVTCDKLNICGARGELVTVRCDYSNINIKTGFWFSEKQRTNWRNKDEPEDLTLDSDYSGRVDQMITYRYSRLTIRDPRERDSGEYQLMIIMKDGVKHLSSVTVNLTVSVLQVKMNPESTGQRVNLSCDSSCPKTSEYKYTWYKNGKHLTFDQILFVSSSENTDSYYCSESYSVSSSSVCLSNSSCWGVTYTSRRVCALVGSTVDIHSSYSHPTGYTVDKTSWDNRRYGAFRDLLKDRQFSGRVEFVGNTLRIKDVNTSDTGHYQFRIITNTSDVVSSSSGVYLTVTVKKTYWYYYGELRDLREDHEFGGRMEYLGNTLRIKDVSMRDTGRYQFRVITNTSDKVSGYPGVYLIVTDSTDRNNEEMDSSVFVSLLVFLPQFLIIGAVWICSCWGVTYTSRRVCALVGSTVDINSSYTHPTGYTVEKTYWYYYLHGKFSDLREVHQFAGRVEFVGNTLRIKDVKKSDSGEYRFRIITNTNSYSGSPGVILTVTGNLFYYMGL